MKENKCNIIYEIEKMHYNKCKIIREKQCNMTNARE